MDETAPITITRTFKLGDYKNLKVNVVQSGLDHDTKRLIMVENALDAYEQLFTHQFITAKLYDGNTTPWEDKLFKLSEIRQDLLQEG